MRMWMISPCLMCRKHLLGEHGELHKFLHNWKKKHSITGRIEQNQMEPLAYKKRHDQLAKEMRKRGYRHMSPLKQPDFRYLPDNERIYTVDTAKSHADLKKRCKKCFKRYGPGNHPLPSCL